MFHYLFKLLLWLFYVPKKDQTCENGYHNWSIWTREDFTYHYFYNSANVAVTKQVRHCRHCKFIETKDLE
jgi:hypothetical protein